MKFVFNRLVLIECVCISYMVFVYILYKRGVRDTQQLYGNLKTIHMYTPNIYIYTYTR